MFQLFLIVYHQFTYMNGVRIFQAHPDMKVGASGATIFIYAKSLTTGKAPDIDPHQSQANFL